MRWMIISTGAMRTCRRCSGESLTIDGSGIGCPSSRSRRSMRSRCDASASAIDLMMSPRLVLPSLWASSPYTMLASTSPCQAWSRRSTASDGAVCRTTPLRLEGVGRGLLSVRRAHHDAHALHGVVLHALEVPALAERLHVAGRVRRARAELVLARPGRVPRVPPSTPRKGRDLIVELGLRPRGATIAAQLDRGDRAQARPCSALDDLSRWFDEPRARHEVRDAGRHQQGARQHARDGRAALAFDRAEVIRGRLLVALERVVEHSD